MVFANKNLFQWKTPNCFSLWQKMGGKKEEKPTNALVYNKMFPAKEKKKNQIFVLLTVETWSREEQGNFTCSCEQAAANSFPR